MLTASMVSMSERHDGGNQREGSTYPKALNGNDTNYLWKTQQFRTEPMHFSPPVELYDDCGRPRSPSLNKSRDLSPQLQKAEGQFNGVLEPISTLKLEEGKKSLHESHLKDSSGVDLRLAPRKSLLMVPPKSGNHISASQPASFERDSEAPSSPVFPFKVPFTQERPSPLSGPATTVSMPKMLDVGLGERRRNSQVSPVSLDVEWEKIKKLRLGTWKLRAKIHEVRKLLREKQLERSIADDRYFQSLRMRGLGVTLENQDISKQQKSMTDLLNDCQKVRDEYGPVEDDCNLLEDQLGRDEFELTKLEESFYKRQSAPESFEDVQQGPVSDSSDASSSSELEIGRESHPLVSEFLSKLGDLDILRERLDYHIEEKFALEYEKDSRRGVGLNLAPEDQEYLDNYEDLEANLMKDIDAAAAEAEKLKRLCFEQGLVDEDGNPADFEKQERQTFVQEAPEVDAGSERSEFVKYPVLLPRPGSKEVQFVNAGPKPAELSNSAGDHINQWLLHQLRSSPLDVNLLSRTFEAETGYTKGEEWQLDVLAFWYKDGAKKGATEYRIYSSGIATQAPRRSRYSTRSLSDTSEHYSLGKAIRSPPSQPKSESEFGSLDSIESKLQFGLHPPPSFPGPIFSRSI